MILAIFSAIRPAQRDDEHGGGGGSLLEVFGTAASPVLPQGHSSRLNNAPRSEQRTKREARDAAEEALRERLRGLLGELDQLLGETDGRWLDFGPRVPNDFGALWCSGKPDGKWAGGRNFREPEFGLEPVRAFRYECEESRP